MGAGTTGDAGPRDERLTTDVDPALPHPLPIPATRIAPIRTRLANKLMRFATRINWAEPELRGIGAVVREGDQVFDVGAAHGMYTLPFAHFVGPRGRVHSFEPHPRQQKQLHFLRRLLGAGQVRVIHAAVGSESGHGTMRLPHRFGFPIYGHAHVAKGARELPAGVKIVNWDTPITTVDEWAAQEGATEISFIKVDVEGFEPNVVAGARTTIDRYRPSLLLEIEDRHLARYGRDANEFATEILTTWPEYRMYTWVGESWEPAERVTVETRNYLFATDAAFARG